MNKQCAQCAHHQLYGFPTLFPSTLYFHLPVIASRSLPFPSTTSSRQLQDDPIPSLPHRQCSPMLEADEWVSLRTAEHPLPASLPTLSPSAVSYAWMHPMRLRTPTRLQTPCAFEHHAPPNASEPHASPNPMRLRTYCTTSPIFIAPYSFQYPGSHPHLYNMLYLCII